MDVDHDAVKVLVAEEAAADLAPAQPDEVASDASSTAPVEQIHLPYLPGLDGLRAIAVIAVLLYHAGIVELPGGFLGVEVFFVISGYLITSLLLAEWRATGRLDLPGFWLRRARRLLPALYVVLVATTLYATLFVPQKLTQLRSDGLAALTYVTNWYLIFNQQSYFTAIGRPSLLRHLWSLAIEEQFYLLWPPLLLLALRRLSCRWLLSVVVALAAASALLMALLYQPGADPSRVYYGTDTRLSGLLIGVILALVWRPRQRGKHYDRALAALVDLAGVIGLLGLVYAFVTLNERSRFLYQGGFPLIGLLTAVAIGVTVSPAARWFPRVLSWAPLRWAGTRSYSLYLWHWPIFMVTRPQVDLNLDELPVLALRLLLTGLCAEASYRWVEMPIRRGALAHLWQRRRELRGARAVLWGSAAAAALFLLGVLGAAVVTATPPAVPDYQAVVIRTPVVTKEPEATPELATPVMVAAAVVTPTPRVPRPAEKVTLIGDSVMISVADPLEESIKAQVYMSAAVGRQAIQAPNIIRRMRAEGQIGQVVILHLGTNGGYELSTFEEIMSLLTDVPRVVIVNVRVPLEWQDANNRMLAANVGRYPNAVFVDWYSASNSHPEYFRDDGVHPTLEGGLLYIQLLSSWANAPIAPPAQPAPGGPTPAEAVPAPLAEDQRRTR